MTGRPIDPIETPILKLKSVDYLAQTENSIAEQSSTNKTQVMNNQSGGAQRVPQTGSGAADESIIGAQIALNQSTADAALDAAFQK